MQPLSVVKLNTLTALSLSELIQKVLGRILELMAWHTKNGCEHIIATILLLLIKQFDPLKREMLFIKFPASIF